MKNELVERESAFVEKLFTEVQKVVVGQREMIERVFMGLICGGHVLLEGAPGLAKTLTVNTLSRCMDLDFKRVQFTPDLLPSDVLGTVIYNHQKGEFTNKQGPIFTNLLLADEINRTPPKTQAALLQAMQEARVSAGGRTHPLPLPFHVFATQNPIEQEGTYPLPEAQLDRFMIEILVDYPDEQAERQIVAMGLGERAALTPVLTPAELTRLQALVRRLPVPPSVVEHVVALLRATRPGEDRCPPALRELLRWGAGPRAGQQLVLAAQARAALAGHEAVSVADVRALAPAVLRHRLVPSFAAESRGVSADELVARALDAVPA
ncbi:MAG: AAA family ATPase [Myxococcales bacterium]|nr:AAA family ATPase [Myxococcales bacterium]